LSLTDQLDPTATRHGFLLMKSSSAMILQVRPIDFKPTRSGPPHARLAWGPTWGAPMRLVRRRWTANRVFVDPA
jgi:hypothetical protein